MTLFTDASPELLAQALAAVSDTPDLQPVAGSPGTAPPAAGAGPLLALEGVSVPTLAGGLAVADLSLVLHPGQHLLIVGEGSRHGAWVQHWLLASLQRCAATRAHA